MKKRGFTLIELLAVIVILAVIALIATPIVLKLIDKVKKGAAESDAYAYIKSVETAAVSYLMDHHDINVADTYEVKNSKLIGKTNNIDFTPSIKGSKAEDGTIIILNDKSVVTNVSNMKIGGYSVDYDPTTNKFTANSESNSKNLLAGGLGKGTAVYYNPSTNKICNQDSAISTIGTKSGCMKWYIYKNNGDGTYQLILDHNTTAAIQWNSSGKNADGMNEIKTTLQNDTNSWKTKEINKTIDGMNYTGFKARLITANEIAEITSNTSFIGTNPTSNKWFYLNSNSQTQDANETTKSVYAWLFDYTNGCIGYGCNVNDSSNYGYWTSTPVFGSSVGAWSVFINGSLGSNYVDAAGRGIRPVITL